MYPSSLIERSMTRLALTETWVPQTRSDDHGSATAVFAHHQPSSRTHDLNVSTQFLLFSGILGSEVRDENNADAGSSFYHGDCAGTE